MGDPWHFLQGIKRVDRVKKVWLQTLWVELEAACMKDDQAIYDYLSRLLVIINWFKSNGASTLSKANLWVELPVARNTFSYAIQQGFLHAVQSFYIWDIFSVKIAKYRTFRQNLWETSTILKIFSKLPLF